MKYAILSTVSSDRMNYGVAADAAGQPHLAELAFLLVDESGESEMAHHLVKPDGWQMSDEATAVSGITNEMLDKNGDAVRSALLSYVTLVADDDCVVVAYGAPHHLKLMRGECRRAGIDDRYATIQSIDLMRALVDVCRIPNVGRKGFKLPKMTEALAHFGIPFPEVRDAVANARLSLELFRRLVDLGRLPAPSLPAND